MIGGGDDGVNDVEDDDDDADDDGGWVESCCRPSGFEYRSNHCHSCKMYKQNYNICSYNIFSAFFSSNICLQVFCFNLKKNFNFFTFFLHFFWIHVMAHASPELCKFISHRFISLIFCNSGHTLHWDHHHGHHLPDAIYCLIIASTTLVIIIIKTGMEWLGVWSRFT